MTKINLLKRKRRGAMTLDEFKTWLNKLIVDKKGALPDLNDWKTIKENLDRVTTTSEHFDMSGYSFIPPIDDEDTVTCNFDYTGYDISMYNDLETLLDMQSHVQSFDNINVTFNGVKVNLESKYETKETEEQLNGGCCGK